MIGTVAGLFFGLPGLIVGPFVGAAIGEWTVHKDLAKSGKAGAAAWIGFAVGTALKVGRGVLDDRAVHRGADLSRRRAPGARRGLETVDCRP